jgi:predicted dehydrogenase
MARALAAWTMRFAAATEFENGTIGTLEATRFAGGHKNHEMLEVNGEKGSIRFDLERMNELQVFWVGE